MTGLFGVSAPPRSGTMWYSRLFSHGDVFCFHELTLLLEPYPASVTLVSALRAATRDHAFEQRQRRHYLDGLPRYFRRLWERADRGARFVGNSDSNLCNFASGLWLLWPETSFLFSTRNGINQVHSTFVWESKLTDVARSARPPGFEQLSEFEISCRRWTSGIRSWTKNRDWLMEHGARCLSTTLERVTSDVEELERVWTWVADDWETHREWAVSRMTRPENARVNVGGAVRTPEDVWELWSEEQRATFVEVCGETQAALGYELPR